MGLGWALPYTGQPEGYATTAHSPSDLPFTVHVVSGLFRLMIRSVKV